MNMQRWPGHPPPDELGAVAHGPLILAGSAAEGVTAGLRCIFAHPAGLHLTVVVAASEIDAEAAGRQRHHYLDEAEARERANHGEHVGVASDPLRQLNLIVEVNGCRGAAEPYQSECSWSEDRYDQQANYWIDQLPENGRIRITTSWPEIGLPEHTTVLTCEPLDDLAHRVHPLR